MQSQSHAYVAPSIPVHANPYPHPEAKPNQHVYTDSHLDADEHAQANSDVTADSDTYSLAELRHDIHNKNRLRRQALDACASPVGWSWHEECGTG